MIFVKPDLWEATFEFEKTEQERWQEHIALHEQKIKELEDQYSELLQMAIENRSGTARRLFEQKQEEIEGQIESHREQLSIARERLTGAERERTRRELVDDMIDAVRDIDGIKGLSEEVKRKFVLALVDQVVADTKEEWFEINGVVSKIFTFVDGDVLEVTNTSARRST